MNLDQYMQNFDAALAKLMPSDLAEQYRKECEARDAKNAELREQLRLECAEAITLLAEAIRRPMICRQDLNEVLAHVCKAQSVAATLDPEDK